MVNPPLASTAVGVVPPQRAGMASGINSTFRQVGIATGIALLGTLFSTRLTSAVDALVNGTPLSGHGGRIATALRGGQAGRLFHSAHGRTEVALLRHIARAGFTTALDLIMLVAAILSIVAGLAAFVLIRGRDFSEDLGAATPDPAAPTGEGAPV
jgi:hypothetical protein